MCVRVCVCVCMCVCTSIIVWCHSFTTVLQSCGQLILSLGGAALWQYAVTTHNGERSTLLVPSQRPTVADRPTWYRRSVSPIRRSFKLQKNLQRKRPWLVCFHSNKSLKKAVFWRVSLAAWRELYFATQISLVYTRDKSSICQVSHTAWRDKLCVTKSSVTHSLERQVVCHQVKCHTQTEETSCVSPS